MGTLLHSDMSPFRLRFMPKPNPNSNPNLSKTMPKPNPNPNLNLSKTMPKPNPNPNLNLNPMSEWGDVGMEHAPPQNPHAALSTTKTSQLS